VCFLFEKTNKWDNQEEEKGICFEVQDWPCLVEWGGGNFVLKHKTGLVSRSEWGGGNWWQRLSGKEESKE
jgi:hypothetical protein